MKIIKITECQKEIWWQWSWDFWRIGIEFDFDTKEYKYISLKLWLLLFALKFYVEWK